jgi:hypothetical protein
VPGFAQVTPCDGTQPPVPSDISVREASEFIARDEYNKEVLRVCDRFCETRGCGGGSACLQNDDPKKKPLYTPPKCGPIGTDVRCTGKVKQCTCQCQSCEGDHRPPDIGAGNYEYDPAYGQGVGATSDEAFDKARAEAGRKCDALCARFKCQPPNSCTRFGDPVIGQMKSWLVQHPAEHYRAKVRILKCSCKCT